MHQSVTKLNFFRINSEGKSYNEMSGFFLGTFCLHQKVFLHREIVIYVAITNLKPSIYVCIEGYAYEFFIGIG